MRHMFNKIAACICLFLLSGCMASENNSVPQKVEVDQTRQATSRELLRALNGGILPKTTFEKLPQREKVRALLAEYQALETSPAGQSVSWQSPNGNYSGSVTPSQPFKVGAQNCRHYSHSARLLGETLTASGSACRSPNGKWVPIS